MTEDECDAIQVFVYLFCRDLFSVGANVDKHPVTAPISASLIEILLAFAPGSKGAAKPEIFSQCSISPAKISRWLI